MTRVRSSLRYADGLGVAPDGVDMVARAGEVGAHGDHRNLAGARFAPGLHLPAPLLGPATQVGERLDPEGRRVSSCLRDIAAQLLDQPLRVRRPTDDEAIADARRAPVG